MKRLRIGTRGSPLARAQTELVCKALAEADPAVASRLDVTIIRTTGDRVVDRPLAELGGKGLFCKELEAALLERRIDLAVHSIKDLPTWLADGLRLAAVLPREDPRDVLITRNGGGIDDLPRGATVGTSSLRRQAQLLARRPDMHVVPYRGNVATRLRKLAAGEVDATLLALAGLRRLGIADEVGGAVLSMEEMLPAVGQGAIGIESRADDDELGALLASVDDAETSICIRAERALLAALDGSCHTPIGGHAMVSGDELWLRALVARPDGSQVLRTERRGSRTDAEAVGTTAGRELRARAGPDLFG